MPRRGNGNKSYAETLLSDPDISTWYRNLAEGSPLTASVYLRRLGNFCKRKSITPKSLLGMNSKEAYRFLLGVVSDYRKRRKKDGSEYAGSYVESVVKALRSWFDFNDIAVTKKVRIADARETPTVDEEQPPTPADLKRILAVTDFRLRTAAAIIAFTGCRLKVIGNYNGTDGLKVSDLPEMKIQNDKVSFPKVPATMIVRKPLSKSKQRYMTFLPREVCDILELYLKFRIIQGEELQAGSPIITSSLGMSKRIPRLKGKHITTTNVSDLLRKALRNAGMKNRPYVLKRYATTRMSMAEGDHIVPHEWVKFWTGWKGDISATYNTEKGLAPDFVEQMRRKYAEAYEKYLATERRGATKDEMLAELRRQLLLFVKYPEQEIRKMGDLSAIPQAEFEKILDKRRNEALGLNGNSQKVVSMMEVRGLIGQGWEFVSPLPNNEAVVRVPNGMTNGAPPARP